MEGGETDTEHSRKKINWVISVAVGGTEDLDREERSQISNDST